MLFGPDPEFREERDKMLEAHGFDKAKPMCHEVFSTDEYTVCTGCGTVVALNVLREVLLPDGTTVKVEGAVADHVQFHQRIGDPLVMPDHGQPEQVPPGVSHLSVVPEGE